MSPMYGPYSGENHEARRRQPRAQRGNLYQKVAHAGLNFSFSKQKRENKQKREKDKNQTV